MKRTFFIIAFIVLPLLVVGCSDQVQLSGTVTFADDGTPLTVGRVVFESNTLHARGDLDANGRFTLATHKPGDGLPPGMYRVYISGASLLEIRGETVIEIPLIAAKYGSAATSGLEVNVDRRTRTFDIQVDRP